MKNNSPQDGKTKIASIGKKPQPLSFFAWLLALGLVAYVAYTGWLFYNRQYQTSGDKSSSSNSFADARKAISENNPSTYKTALPVFMDSSTEQSIKRRVDLYTIIPSRPRQDVRDYVVSKGDSVFEIAEKFNIEPETVLWANYDQLNDNPHLISIGMELQIPPTDGIVYQWQEGDTIETVAGSFEAPPENILNWPTNNLDLSNPQIQPGTQILVPGGQREFKQWLIPTIPRTDAGVSSSLYGQGACEGSFEGAYGTGTFVWPAANHTLSGNDYWDGHLAIDMAAGTGAQIYAVDSGVVVFAGWARFGYGNTIMIDHGNGYQSLYAHLSNAAVSCGRSVNQGSIIGYAGDTGNSTGSHLHFEIRYLGGFVSPWYVLPAP